MSTASQRLLPDDERFGLKSQIRPAALAILTNIAAGCGYETAALRHLLKAKNTLQVTST